MLVKGVQAFYTHYLTLILILSHMGFELVIPRIPQIICGMIYPYFVNLIEIRWSPIRFEESQQWWFMK